MTKHYVLRINPQAQYDWDSCVLRDPISGARPDFAAMVARAVENEPGAYLIAVKLEVEVLETSPNYPQEEEVAYPETPTVEYATNGNGHHVS